VVASAITAWSVANERVSGRTGWLVTRSVSRATYVLGWFGALVTIGVLGLAAAGFLAWMAAAGGFARPDPAELIAALCAVAAGVAAAIAFGLLAAALARPLTAALVAALGCVAVGAASLTTADAAAVVPWVVLADVAGPDSVLGMAMLSAGVALLACAVLLSLARVATERAEL
ncbi:MAG TPA: hypothetical protein VFN76_08435, partial [Candidatus Limnocylindria bacterium]|nr:hypothetical protein [Candidatus Limnocylindria bacterium]